MSWSAKSIGDIYVEMSYSAGVRACVLTFLCDCLAKYNKENSGKKKRKALKRKEKLAAKTAAECSQNVRSARKKVCVSVSPFILHHLLIAVNWC